MFRKTKEYNIIYRLLFRFNLLNEYASFECFADSIATYQLFNGIYKHEFNLITDDMIFKSEKTSDLLNLKNITYFSHSFYNKETGEKISGYDWAFYKESDQN